ncbi:hypothetical protein CWO85_00420 [Candidatus Phytoplasma ziziphi]|uniref:Uncharacterized protein n=1 Tax=Ziziphus jujuba witches'-broom phytoplasma TaxID=135727 RepID=A0A660HLT1_ZIZJU|nr:hypothetical protein CWO85_00420 [Candidatus Phytoplasma ziziphi]
MKKIKLFKLICFFTVILLNIIFIILSVLPEYNIFAENISKTKLPNKYFIFFIRWIVCINFFLVFIGIQIYIVFKICKGSELVYKDPNKGGNSKILMFPNLYPI